MASGVGRGRGRPRVEERSVPVMREYFPDGEVLDLFMSSRARAKVIQGPIGSGKTLACAMSIYMKGLEQRPQADGRRRCRVHVFRDTYGKLEETTLKTWLEWFPEKTFGRFYWSKPFLHEIRIGDMELDVSFVALEDQKDVDFFRSLETTMCYFNELQFTDRILFDEAVTRVGRYPRQIDGGAVNPQVIGDMNAPAADHWVPIMRGDVAAPDYLTEEQRRALVKPQDWEFFVQPPGLVEVVGDGGDVIGYRENVRAENRKYLERDYYLKAIAGKTRSWIDSNVMNRSAVQVDGKAVHGDFRRELHVAPHPLGPIPGLPLWVGLDFGRSPAAVVGQCLRGRWYVLAEVIGHDIGADNFAPFLRGELARRFPDWVVRGRDRAGGGQDISGQLVQFWGDPSGDFRGQADDRTPFQVFRKHGLMVRPASSNLLTVRLQAVDGTLTRLLEGKPALLISPVATMLIAALGGGYHLRRLQVRGERYGEEPEKNQYSHVADALQYMLLGGGEGRRLVRGPEPAQPVNTVRRYDVFTGRQRPKARGQQF